MERSAPEADDPGTNQYGIGTMGSLARSAKPLRSVVILGCAALLFLAVLFQGIYTLREVPQSQSRTRIVDAVSRMAPGWTTREEPLGQTEIVNEAVLKTLNLDDYVYRRFQKGGHSFTVYAAYWARGRMPTRLVASHTPDRCWTENGMRCVDMRFRQEYAVGGRPLLPAEYRVFTAGGSAEKREDGKAGNWESGKLGNGAAESSVGARPLAPSTSRPQAAVDRSARESVERGRIYVAYWHTVEGKLYDYGERFNAVPDPWLWWKDTLTQAAYGSREQLFVRIASETPLEELWNEPGFLEVMRSVADLGLWAEDR